MSYSYPQIRRRPFWCLWKPWMVTEHDLDGWATGTRLRAWTYEGACLAWSAHQFGQWDQALLGTDPQAER